MSRRRHAFNRNRRRGDNDCQAIQFTPEGFQVLVAICLQGEAPAASGDSLLALAHRFAARFEELVNVESPQNMAACDALYNRVCAEMCPQWVIERGAGSGGS